MLLLSLDLSGPELLYVGEVLFEALELTRDEIFCIHDTPLIEMLNLAKQQMVHGDNRFLQQPQSSVDAFEGLFVNKNNQHIV